MGSYCVDEYFGSNGLTRPTFLSLSVKRNGFFPTLPRTPEHGIPHESLHETNRSKLANWDVLVSYENEAQAEYDDDSDVFVLPGSCEEKTSAIETGISSASVTTTKQHIQFGVCADAAVDPPDNKRHCCSQWFRAYFSKLRVKNGNDRRDSELNISSLPKPCTILERETTLKRISPKRMRRISKKRLSSTSAFICATFLEDTVIELREERHKDVVYSITIKKEGSLQRNGSLNKSFLDDDSTKERNTSRHMKGATLDFMVDRLAEVFSGENEDVNYLNVFLTTYRTFATPGELFRKLKHKYMDLNGAPMKDLHAMRSIMRVFRAWLERYFVDDFQDGGNNKLLAELHELAKLHDDITNQNEVDSPLSKGKNIISPIHTRKNGLMHTVGFSDFVAAKVAVVSKSNQSPQEIESPQNSPCRLHNPDLDVSERSTVNTSPAKVLLNEFSSTHIAAQLTVIAAKLFHLVKPHHCLATVSSPKSDRPRTVKATINQFNKVVYCVIGTVLCPCLKLAQRTKLLTKWIEVAQECRELKNFSSLRAIVSGLQTHSLHRLKRAWTGVPQSHMNLLKELAEMNMKDVLMKVGTAKVNTEDSAITRVRKEATLRREQDMHSGIMHGTVPYLGSFLTDLTYLDTARPNFLEGGLINFEKRRKEFELLAQLQLWQASCRSYQNLQPDEEFVTWFESITVLSEEQSYALSEVIEPQVSSVSSPIRPLSPGKKNLPEMIHAEMERNMPSPPTWHKHQRRSENGVVGKELNKVSAGRINNASSPSDKNRAVRIRLIRKQSEAGIRRAETGVDYKTIRISSDERRAAVIKKALETFGLDVEENQKKFSLVQILHDKEIQIPDTANVFYAMSSSDQEPTLLLLEDGAVIPQKNKRHQSTPNRAKKTRHRKNFSLTYTHEPESGRSSPSVISPMKSFINQLTLNSVALVSSSYSISDASSRRSSEGDSEVAGSDGVVLTNSRSGIELVDFDEINEMGVDVPVPNLTNRRSSRCYSADYGSNGVILPVRVVRSSRALSSNETRLITIKSAPTSPNLEDRKYSDQGKENDRDHDVITATGRLVEWPRYSASTTGSTVGRSSTWSSRRAMRRPKKVKTSSTFYVTSQVAEKDVSGNTSNEHEVFHDSSIATVTSRPQNIYSRSASAQTLPGRFIADFSGHDYPGSDVITHQKLTSSFSFDTSRRSSSSQTRGTSFGSVSSGASNPDSNSLDGNTGLSFTSARDRIGEDHVTDGPFTDSDSGSASDRDVPHGAAVRPPLIKVQSPSPNRIADDESEFFRRYDATKSAVSDSDSSSEGYKNLEDIVTFL